MLSLQQGFPRNLSLLGRGRAVSSPRPPSAGSISALRRGGLINILRNDQALGSGNARRWRGLKTGFFLNPLFPIVNAIFTTGKPSTPSTAPVCAVLSLGVWP